MGKALSPFYVTGGTLRPDAPSYVEREADRLLLEALQARELCYVLTARQTGKSSLMVRTAAALRGVGDRVAILDLTLLGQHLTREQWYYGLLDVLAEQLDLEDELEAFWSEHEHLGPAQRFLSALAQVALPRSGERLVLFIDEVDAVQALPFSTDEFFAGIRACYNRRATGELEGLAFCLLGVAAPSDLIQDPRTTPFNIGRRIELTDFTPAEAARLAEGLRGGLHARDAAVACGLLRRVLYWTGGHPSLTQQLCKAIAENGPTGAARDVDRACQALFLSAGARRNDEHLLFIQERLLRTGGTLPAILELYGRLLSGRRVEDRQDPVQELLRLAGIVRTEKGRLHVRNRIYARVFNRAWVTAHLPDAEARRQQAAFRRGLLRAGTVGAIFVGLFGSVATFLFLSEAKTRRLAGDLQQSLEQRARLLGERNAALGRLEGTVHRLKAEQEKARSEARRARASESQERSQRQAADAARAAAELQQRLALNLRQLSERQRKEIRSQLVRLQISAGESALAAGRPLEALPWFVEALRHEAASEARAEDHRIRIASVLGQGPRLLQFWQGRGTLRGLLSSPDGSRLALGYADGTVTLYDTASGVQIGPIIRGRDPINFSFSRDSRLIAVSHGAVVQVRSARDGSLVGGPLKQPEEVLSTIFTHDGRTLLLGLQRGDVSEWDHTSGELPRVVLREDEGPARFMRFSGDDQFLVISSSAFTSIWDWRARRKVTRTRSLVYALSPDGKSAAVVTPQGYSLATLPDLKLFEPALPPLRQLRFAPDGRRLFLEGEDGTVREWDVPRGILVGEERKPPYVYPRNASWADERRVLVTAADGAVRLWDTTVEPPEYEIRPDVPSGVADVSSDGREVALPGADGRVRIWSTETGRALGPAIQHGAQVFHAAFSPDGRRIATAGLGGPPRIWDRKTGQPAALRLESPKELPAGASIRMLAFSPRGDLLLSVRSDGHSEVYNLRNGRIISPRMPWNSLPRRWEQAPFSPDGRRVLLPDGPTSSLLWTLRGGRFVQTRIGVPIPNHTIFTLAGQALLGPGKPDAPQLVHVETGRAVGRALSSGDEVGSFYLSPNGRQVVLTSGDAARVWDIRTRQPLLPPLSHASYVRHVAFSRDGRRLVTTTLGGRIRVWDVRTGEPITAPLPAPGVFQARFNARGDRVVGIHETGGAVSVWKLRADTRPVSELLQLAAILSGQRLDPTVGPANIRPEALARAGEALRRRYPGEFRPSSGREWAWQRQKALEAENAQRWEAAVGHLDRLIAVNPGPGELYQRRARAHAELGHWAAVARDLQVLVRRGASEPLTFSELALAQLGGGDLAGYRRTCTAMLSRCESFPTVRQRDLTARTCALGPRATADLEQPIRVMRGLLAGNNNASWPGTLGALLYRAGRPAEALAALRQSREAQGGEGSPADLLVYGLAAYAAGKPTEARAALERARQRRDEIFSPGSGGYVAWQLRLEVQLLERELATALQTDRSRGPNTSVR